MRPHVCFRAVSIVACLCRDAAAQGLYFSIPGPTSESQDYSIVPTYTVGETMKMSWKTDLTAYNITLWQQNLVSNDGAYAGPAVFSTDGTSYATDSFRWEVQRYRFIPNMNVFYLLATSADGNQAYSSSYFNITDTSAGSTPSPTPTSLRPTASTTSTRSSATSPTVSVESASSPTTSPLASSIPSSATDNSSLKIGLGVGLGVGLPLFLAAGVAIGWWISRKNRSSYHHPGQHEISGQGLERKELSAQPARKYPSELSSYRRDYELSA